MPRRRLIPSAQFPYHVTARVNNREQFPGDLSYAWKTLTEELHLQSILCELRVHALVLMPNHIHLLCSTPGLPINRCMQNFLSAIARIIHTRTKRSGHLFGERYHWSLIQNPLYYAHALKYVYRNPVKAELCDAVEHYPFSTISGLLGMAPLPIALYPVTKGLDRLVPENYSQLTQWLNQPHKREEAHALQKALRRKIFKLPVNRNTRKIFTLPEIDAPPSPKGSDTKWWSHPDSNGDQSFRKDMFYPTREIHS